MTVATAEEAGLFSGLTSTPEGKIFVACAGMFLFAFVGLIGYIMLALKNKKKKTIKAPSATGAEQPQMPQQWGQQQQQQQQWGQQQGQQGYPQQQQGQQQGYPQQQQGQQQGYPQQQQWG
jgi:hypothetical protein